MSFEIRPDEVERSAQTRLAVQTHSMLLPVLEKGKREALRRVFGVLERGQVLDPQAALGAILELYAIEKLERVLRQQIRRGNTATGADLPRIIEEMPAGS